MEYYWVGPLWVVVMAVEGETVRFATKSKYEITENSLAGVTAVIGWQIYKFVP